MRRITVTGRPPHLLAAPAVAGLGDDQQAVAFDAATAQMARAVLPGVHPRERRLDVGEHHARGRGEPDADLYLGGVRLTAFLGTVRGVGRELPELLLPEQPLLVQVLAQRGEVLGVEDRVALADGLMGHHCTPWAERREKDGRGPVA
ncbi:hypothetical protein SHKM778_55700 [Streptomyces sp. KM77-8]|uniref:Uncharacterized protein n=1 Tax=Streptomyces haneummycinicus TaxID=3074435 RepID=A0AAT9HPG7_9ACTN